jgi:multidrug efflux pump subunit AcrA (membrane-fusion protein)
MIGTRTIAALATLVLAMSAACTGRGNAGDRDAGGAPKAVRIGAVEWSANPEPTRYSAIIGPNAQVDLAFRVSGYIVSIHQTKAADGRIHPVEAGAPITRGMTLARVRVADYQTIVDKATGAREESTAGISAARAQLAEAQAGLEQAESEFTRIDALWQQESITKPAYDGSKAKRDVARAKVDAAKASLTAAEQRAASAAAQLQEAQIALDDTAVRAPFDGTLLERRVDVGSLVSAGTPAFVIADLHLVKARFNVPDTALRHFKNGQPLTLSVDAFAGQPFEGRVLAIAAAADPRARSFEITVTIPNPDLRLRSGMIASIGVNENPGARRYARIPIDALVHEPTADRYVAYTTEQREGRTVVRAVPVRPGPLDGNHVLILDGLKAGQRIVVSGANLLRPGDSVTEIQ